MKLTEDPVEVGASECQKAAPRDTDVEISFPLRRLSSSLQKGGLAAEGLAGLHQYPLRVRPWLAEVQFLSIEDRPLPGAGDLHWTDAFANAADDQAEEKFVFQADAQGRQRRGAAIS